MTTGSMLVFALALGLAGCALGFRPLDVDGASTLDFVEAAELAPWGSAPYGGPTGTNSGRRLQQYQITVVGVSYVFITGSPKRCADLTPADQAALLAGYTAMCEAEAAKQQPPGTCVATGLQCVDVAVTTRRLQATYVLGITITFDLTAEQGQVQGLVSTLNQEVVGGVFANYAVAAGFTGGTILGVQLDNGGPTTCIPSQGVNCPPVWDPNTDPGQPVELPKTLLSFQVDSLVINSQPCGVYWQSSQPSGSAGPNAAVRVGMRTTANTIAKEMGVPNEIDGGPNVVKRTSVLCTNPPSTAKARNKKKKRLRVALSPAVPPDQNGVFLNKLAEKVNSGVFKQNAANRGAGEWTPLPMRYVTEAQAVCIPSVGTTGCPAGAWNPSKAVLI